MEKIASVELFVARFFYLVGCCYVGFFFDYHVVKFFGIKDFATFQALDELRVFVPRDDAYPGMFAGRCHRDRFKWIRMLFPPIVAAFVLNSSAKMAYRVESSRKSFYMEWP